MYDWNNNPRVEIEKRIKQLDGRLNFLRQFTGMGSIDYEDGIAVRFYPSLTPRKMRDKAGKLIRICRAEYDRKWKQLKSF